MGQIETWRAEHLATRRANKTPKKGASIAPTSAVNVQPRPAALPGQMWIEELLQLKPGVMSIARTTEQRVSRCVT